jgi:Xaa-Pro aminopeptidase
MGEKGIDGLLLARPENLAYFSGFRRPSRYQFVCDVLLIPRDSPPALLVPVEQRAQSEMLSWLDDIRYYVAGKSTSFAELSDAKETGLKLLHEFGFDNKVIGVETNPQVSDQKSWDTFMRSLRTTKEVDDLIWKQRMVKSTLEIKYIRKSCQIISDAFRKALSSMHEGMTERELARIVYRTALDEGAEDTPLAGALNVKGGSGRYAMSDTRPTDYKLRKGDIVVLDGGMPFRGYWSDITRLTCIGPPSERQKQMFDACLEAETAAVNALKPGARISEVYRAAQQTIERNGLEKNKLPQEPFGHGLGLELHEPPYITPQSEFVLEPGMVLAIEPCLYDDQVLRSFLETYTPGGEGVFFVEDNVLITENGSENLTPISRELNTV